MLKLIQLIKIDQKKINFDVINILNGCGRIVEALEVEVNKVNYTMNVDFNTKSTDINLTTITNFEPYQYNKEIYQIEEKVFQNVSLFKE